jgi:RNA polymerase sigma factor (sigma-70 family)
MQDMSDAQLLRDYAEHGTEAAFYEIVVRHADLVYSAALRQVGSPDLACDVAQSVFSALASKTSPLVDQLAGGASLVGWLYRSTRFAALKHLRDDRRRLAHEQQALDQLTMNSEAAPDWERVRPVLDEAMAGLNDEECEALLLRFFKKHDFHAVGVALGVSDDTAQKRISRALEKLRQHLASRGITSPATALSAVIMANTVQAAPAGLATTVSSAAVLAGTTLTSTVTATKAIAVTTLQKTLITTAIALAVGAGIYETRQASTLRSQVQALQQRQEPLAEQIQQLQNERDSSNSKAATLRPADASRIAPFDWRQVESADYKQYIANLRAIGCPEKTIKNIIVADVNDLFSSRMASVTQTNQYQYWKKEPVSRSEEQRKQLRDLYTQKQDLLKVLGVDTPDFTDLLGEAYRDGMEERDLQLAFLPAFKWQQTKEALFQQAQQEVAEDNSVERSGAIEQQTQARIQALLTPEEFKEYELRCSTDALNLRGVLDPLALTEQEFRAIFDSWRNSKAFSPGATEYRATQQSRETTLQQLLGPDRFQLYLGAVKLLGYSK